MSTSVGVLTKVYVCLCAHKRICLHACSLLELHHTFTSSSLLSLGHAHTHTQTHTQELQRGLQEAQRMPATQGMQNPVVVGVGRGAMQFSEFIAHPACSFQTTQAPCYFNLHWQGGGEGRGGEGRAGMEFCSGTRAFSLMLLCTTCKISVWLIYASSGMHHPTNGRPGLHICIFAAPYMHALQPPVPCKCCKCA